MHLWWLHFDPSELMLIQIKKGDTEGEELKIEIVKMMSKKKKNP